MKISEVLVYLNATYKKWGDVECLIDVDPSDDDLYEMASIFVDLNPEDETDANLVFALFETKHKLVAVK